MKKIRIIILTIAIILIPLLIYYAKDNNEIEDINYGNLENYYSIELLSSSYDKLQTYISDERFINENGLNKIDFKNIFDLNISSGFLINDEFDFGDINYATLKESSDINLGDSKIIRFDDKGYYYITYYNNLYSDKLVPVVIYSYQLDNINRIDFCLILTDNDWELFKVINLRNGD